MSTTSGTNVLNIIHLPNAPEYPHRELRERSFLKQIEEQGIEDYRVWEGIFIKDMPVTAISRSHKMIVRHAKEMGWPRVIIAEDDFYFKQPGGWRYFLDSIVPECDIFLSHTYHGKFDETGRIHGEFSSLTLYCVHEKFYDKFLSVTEYEHIDLILNRSWKYDVRVCLPQVCGQVPGWSENIMGYRDINGLPISQG